VNQLAHLVFIQTPGRGALKLRRRKTAGGAKKAVRAKLTSQAINIDVQCLSATDTQRRRLRSQAVQT
jgi:hypothetical protein